MRERKRNRLKGYNYSTPGIYFLTICCQNREHWLGKINNKKMELNEYGNIVEQQIEWLEQHYPYFVLHNFVIMPNHLHILAEINRMGNNISDNNEFFLERMSRAGRDRPQQKRNVPTDDDIRDDDRPPQKIKSISELMGAFKTTSSKKIHRAGNTDFQWQRSFHDHIVKSGESYKRIHAYINLNPTKWAEDQLFNPEIMQV